MSWPTKCDQLLDPKYTNHTKTVMIKMIFFVYFVWFVVKIPVKRRLLTRIFLSCYIGAAWW